MLFVDLGGAATAAGDVNGDGYDDVLVTELFYGNGIVYLYRGSASGLSSTPAWTGSGSQSSSRFGYSVASLGDMNCDGHDDVIIGEPLYAQGSGRVLIYLGGSPGLLPTPQWWTNALSAQAEFGSSVATAGNVGGFPRAAPRRGRPSIRRPLRPEFANFGMARGARRSKGGARFRTPL